MGRAIGGLAGQGYRGTSWAGLQGRIAGQGYRGTS